MPSRSTLMAVAWTLAALAVVSRVPAASRIVFNQ
jgi:hypothetical protein